MTRQHLFTLPPFSRGFHVITSLVLDQLGPLPEAGILHLYIQHTSAGLAINEAADPDVPVDFEAVFNHLVPENLPFLTHTLEGPDDMPAHVKSVIAGSSISMPIVHGRLALGTWQGIYLCEFRNRGGARHLVATVIT